MPVKRMNDTRLSGEGTRTPPPTLPSPDAGAGLALKSIRGVYVASKVKHAEVWKRLRSHRSRHGQEITATWIDEAGEGQTADHAELATRCLNEVAKSKAVILYCEPGEILKGALIEVGAALVLGIPVYCVGTCESLSVRTFSKHPLWHEEKTVNEAIGAIIIHDRLKRAESRAGAAPVPPATVATAAEHEQAAREEAEAALLRRRNKA